MIFFRADANSEIGSGHIMRCLSIAAEFEKHSINCCFITADHNADALIDSFQMNHHCLNTVWNQLDNETEKLLEYLYRNNAEVLIVDHYSVTEKYLKNIKKCCKLVYIDDLNAFVYPVDILVNYNIYSEYLKYNEEYNKFNTRFLLGTKYVPLRKEFQNIKSREIKEKVENVLISTGGSDPLGIGISLLKSLMNNFSFSEMKFHFVLGSLNAFHDEIINIAENSENIIIYENVQRMDLLMQKCDIAISAAGSTLYELCVCGIPTITYILADNQKMGAEAFEKAGLMINSGDCRNRDDFTAFILNQLKTLSIDFIRRKEMSESCSKLVDGKGVQRMYSFIISSCFSEK